MFSFCLSLLQDRYYSWNSWKVLDFFYSVNGSTYTREILIKGKVTTVGAWNQIFEYQTFWSSVFQSPKIKDGHYFVLLLASLDQFLKHNNFSFEIQLSRLAKSSVFQWSRPLENRTRWWPFYQPLENRTPSENRIDPYH